MWHWLFEVQRGLLGLSLLFEKPTALGTQAALGMAHQSHPLDPRVRNKSPAVRAKVTLSIRLLAHPTSRIRFCSSGQRTLARSLRQGHRLRRVRQAEIEIADAQRVPWAKLRAGQSAQIGLRGDGLAWRQKKHLLPTEHQQTVMRINRRMRKDQVVVLVASDANDGLVIFEVNGAEDRSMVNKFKHRALPWD